MADRGGVDRGRIGFPVKCEYKGGLAALGRHGRNLWIRDGQIGHGELTLTHGLPLSEVHSVEVAERVFGDTSVEIHAMPGLPVTRTVRGTAPKLVTDIVIRTANGLDGIWTVEDHSSDWVRDRLRPALTEAGIPFYDDLLPHQRPTTP
jgi:hypothetical protein